MRKLKIITLDQYADATVRSLHEEGIVQIQDISERIQQDAQWRQILKPSKSTPYTAKVSSLLMKTTGLVDFLDSVSKKDQSILNTIKGFISPPDVVKREVPDLDTEELIQKAEETINEVEQQTRPFEDALTQLDAERSEVKNAQDVAGKLLDFDVDLGNLEDTDYTSVVAGRMSSESFEKFKEGYSSVTDKIVILEGEKSSDNLQSIIIITRKEFGDEIAGLLRKLEFERFEMSGISGKPKEIMVNSESRLESIEVEKNGILDKLGDVSAQWEEPLLILKEQLEIEKDRNEIFSSFGETDKTVMLEAWVTAKQEQQALEIIETTTQGHSVVEATDPEELDEIPVKMDNPRFAKPYEFFVDMYAPPSYKEIDPTILVAIIFPFFFGFCLTDAGYGIIDALIGFVLYRGLGKANKTMHDLGLIFIACGVWAFILGMITNGFIGDFFPKWITGGTPIFTTIPSIDAFVHPEYILVFALIVGVIHINMGLIMGAINNLNIGDFREALGTNLVWIILEIGVAIFAVGYLMSGGLGTLAMIGIGIIAVSLGMLLYFNGFFGLMDVSGFLGNLLSYARLLALCLSTGGIAMTVNILTGLSVDMIPYIGIIIAPIIFIGGHIANLLFQSLGAFINSMRLHYVEFFSQFYVGGSSKFEAFEAERQFTKVTKK